MAGPLYEPFVNGPVALYNHGHPHNQRALPEEPLRQITIATHTIARYATPL